MSTTVLCQLRRTPDDPGSLSFIDLIQVGVILRNYVQRRSFLMFPLPESSTQRQCLRKGNYDDYSFHNVFFAGNKKTPSCIVCLHHSFFYHNPHLAAQHSLVLTPISYCSASLHSHWHCHHLFPRGPSLRLDHPVPISVCLASRLHGVIVPNISGSGMLALALDQAVCCHPSSPPPTCQLHQSS